ncbi:GNAT family N-acetyltransferase [Kitasatospora sp. SC0581]|uniref:GNAT family N-acetyltransferase n=1 Tax=Kitasatospora sp. SC0581 TaxID=3394360 RepID=UPI003A867377
MTHAFPRTVLHTPRLTLRPFTADDTDDTRAACADDLTQHWLPLPRPYTREDAHTWCTRTAHDLRTTGDGIHFAVTERTNGRLAATVGLKKTDWRSRSSEAGYWVAPWARGRGIAAEATRALAHWLLTAQAFERLELKAATANTASRRTALNAGLREEGVLRNAGFTHHGRTDLVLYSLVPADLGSSPTA